MELSSWWLLIHKHFILHSEKLLTTNTPNNQLQDNQRPIQQFKKLYVASIPVIEGKREKGLDMKSYTLAELMHSLAMWKKMKHR